MIATSKETDSSTNQEGNTNDGKVTKASSSSSPWLRLKDPRIVRVSRAFGGKDRHSKVCTIRGLRDRRVRLSVPTAIQLYDLQDRLGLNQPSKVVDWLLNAAKHEIDELPPLPVPPESFGLNHQAMLLSHHELGTSQSNKEGSKMSNNVNWEDPGGLIPRSSFWNSDSFWRSKSKEALKEDTTSEKENWTKRNEEEKEESSEGHHDHGEVSTNNFLNRGNQNSLPGLLNNNAVPYGSYYHFEPSNFPVSHLGSHGFTSQQTEDHHHHHHLHNSHVAPFLPSTLSLSSGSQILVCPPGTTTQTLFPSHGAASVEIDPRQLNQFQMVNTAASQNLLTNSMSPLPYSLNQSMRPFHFNMTHRFLHSDTSRGSTQAEKEQEYPPK